MESGLSHTTKLIVENHHTALNLGSGDLQVLATPQLVAIMENAAMLAVKDHLPEGATTVGAMISTTHLHPTPIGKQVEATATLKSVEGRKLTFAVIASDEKGTIGEGEHIRYVVDKEKFLSKL